jgi:hypothetical protein
MISINGLCIPFLSEIEISESVDCERIAEMSLLIPELRQLSSCSCFMSASHSHLVRVCCAQFPLSSVDDVAVAVSVCASTASVDIDVYSRPGRRHTTHRSGKRGEIGLRHTTSDKHTESGHQSGVAEGVTS